MPKSVFYTWVKNVNKLGFISGDSCVLQSTRTNTFQNDTFLGWVKVLIYQLILPTTSTHFYTYSPNKFNLLNKSFTYFPQNLLINLLK